MTRPDPTGLLGLLPIAALVAGWAAIVGFGLVPAAIVPSPLAVMARCWASLGDPAFRTDLAVTLMRLGAGFGLALAIGVPLGILGGTDRFAGAVLRPLVRVLAPVPKIALYPALILSLGFGSASKVVLVAADALFPILLATYGGAVAVEPKLLWSAWAAGTSPRRALYTVVLPASLPAIVTGARIGLVVGCVVVFLAEMIASADGLGAVLIRAGRNFQTADMFVPLVTIAALGLVLDAALALAARWLLAGAEVNV